MSLIFFLGGGGSDVDLGVNGAIGTIVTKWDLIVFR